MTLRRWALLGVLFAGGWAQAQEQQVKAPEVKEAEDDPGRFRVGINLGIVSLPRPLIIEGYARVHPYLGIAGNWSYFPKFASDALLNWAGAQSETTKGELNDFSGWEIALRVYPMRGTFYLGVGFGHQNLEATVTETQGGFTGVGFGRVESWVITPHIGWQWVWRSGFAIGVDLGVQVTVGHTDTIVLPPGTPADVEQDVRDLIHFGASVPLPVLSFRIGYHFG
jgi:hypothetical protein